MQESMTNMRRIPSLDGLRALSITLVILGHLGGTKNYPHLLDKFENYANFGVRVFFVISGYLITGLLIQERERSGGISLKKFYWRRLLRIFPAAYAYITAVTLIARGYLTRFDIIAAYAYLGNFHMSRPWLTGH